MNGTDNFTQMIEFNETVFNNIYNTMILVQDQAPKVFESFWEKNIFLPQETRNLIDEWTKFNQTIRDSFKSYIDTAFTEAKTWFSEAKDSAALTQTEESSPAVNCDAASIQAEEFSPQSTTTDRSEATRSQRSRPAKAQYSLNG